MKTSDTSRRGAPHAGSYMLAMTPEMYAEKRNHLIASVKEAKNLIRTAMEDIAALDHVWVQIFGQAPFEGGAKESRLPKTSGTRNLRWEVRHAIPAAVEQVRGDFSAREVNITLAAMLPEVMDFTPYRSLISTTLKRMAQDGKLALRHQGRGRAPNIYRRLDEVSELPI